MRTLGITLALPLFLAACGGSGTEQAFRDAAPSAAALSVDVDASPPAGSPSSSLMGTGDLPGDVCHPHLFVRTQRLAARLNQHVLMALARMESVMQRAPAIATDETFVWQETRGEVEVRFTMTRPSETVYTWNLELRPAGATDWTSVFRGDVDRAGATAPHQGAGEMTIDLAALHAVLPEVPVDGLLRASFDLAADHRKLVVDAGGVRWAPSGTPMGTPAMPEISPPDARYVYYREPLRGGSLKIADRMVFLCPDNLDLAPAEVRLVSRWYRLQDGSVRGRSDGRMTEGQLTPDRRIAGVTCHARTADGTAEEGFWLMKLEEGDSVLWSKTYASGDAACDPAFGPVPAADSTQGDFDFQAVDFTDNAPYPFPGM
ncbi:MAG TPA: hypothetical protein VLS93_04555 [Anaeromyxobacteraceae bacterium]|nr:hypothetical protein [Anaeromyxobacteraceae bacterium]